MANMSYCRFQNTARDLADCVEAIENNSVSLDLTDDNDRREAQALLIILDLAKDIIAYETDIEEITNN
jgi:uncharacterized protein with von Willebrand factor type A (vWA) domain|tara:strand:- start:123 stop:326 length:204 start_codon:yes stop_codon:yes gene_type:complete